MLPRDLKSLMSLLSARPRLAIVDAVARSPGIDTQGIALSLSLAAYQIEPHLDALHEGGILVRQKDEWDIARAIEATPEGEFLRLKAHVQDGDYIELCFHPEDSREL